MIEKEEYEEERLTWRREALTGWNLPSPEVPEEIKRRMQKIKDAKFAEIIASAYGKEPLRGRRKERCGK